MTWAGAWQAHMERRSPFTGSPSHKYKELILGQTSGKSDEVFQTSNGAIMKRVLTYEADSPTGIHLLYSTYDIDRFSVLGSLKPSILPVRELC